MVEGTFVEFSDDDRPTGEGIFQLSGAIEADEAFAKNWCGEEAKAQEDEDPLASKSEWGAYLPF